MATLNIREPKDIETLRRRGAKAVVVVKYAYDASEEKGDVVSWHKSFEAAMKRCPDNGFYALHDISNDY